MLVLQLCREMSVAGVGELVDHTIVIWLNPQLAQNHLETVAVHEIMHFTLQYAEKFPYWGGPGGIKLELRQIWELAGSTVQDLLVNRTIAECSFDWTPEQETGIRTLLTTLSSPSFEEPPLHSTKGMRLALKYALFSLGHKVRTTERLLSLCRATCPHISQLGDALVAQIQLHGYETPEQQVNSLKAVRNLLGLRTDHYGIYDWSIPGQC